MTAPVQYVSFPGAAREALEFYAEIFGGHVHLNTFDEFSRSDGPGEAIAHGAVGGTVIDPLAPKPWVASDGQVVDRYGLRWLIGYEPEV